VYLAEDHERIALGLNDVVVRRLFAAGLDLHAALALMGDHRATGKISHAIDELDQAIQNIRDTIFNHLAGERPAPPSVPARYQHCRASPVKDPKKSGGGKSPFL
jgi:hypothetical protein